MDQNMMNVIGWGLGPLVGVGGIWKVAQKVIAQRKWINVASKALALVDEIMASLKLKPGEVKSTIDSKEIEAILEDYNALTIALKEMKK